MQTFFENVILPKLKSRNKANTEIKLGKAYFVGRDLTKASLDLSKEVIERQIEGTISYSEAANLLDTKAKYLEDIKEAVGFGS